MVQTIISTNEASVSPAIVKQKDFTGSFIEI